MKAAVIGSPISHSLSPVIFNFMANHEGVKLNYQLQEMSQEHVHKFIKDIINEKDWIGCNVTIPLKEVLVTTADHISPEVNVIGALNVLHFKNKQIYAFNTDVIGIEETLNNEKIKLHGKNCLIYGAGGAAKAVLYVLGKLKASQVFIINKSNKSRELIHHFAKTFPHTSFQIIKDVEDLNNTTMSLLVNATPLGMEGKESGENFFSGIKKLNFDQSALAFDLVYVPKDTTFLKASKKIGLKTVGGLKMLIVQAMATWEIWFGPLKDKKNLQIKLNNYLQGILILKYSEKSIFLTGFMGVGKSTTGKLLADMTKRDYLDTDALIEKKSQLSIEKLFKTKGEAGFRESEDEVLKQIVKEQKKIVSLGGGALTKEENLNKVINNGILIYLKANPETLEKRITQQNSKRPILDNLEGFEKLKKINALLEIRKINYERADHIIDTEGKNIEQVCFDIISSIGALH